MLEHLRLLLLLLRQLLRPEHARAPAAAAAAPAAAPQTAPASQQFSQTLVAAGHEGVAVGSSAYSNSRSPIHHDEGKVVYRSLVLKSFSPGAFVSIPSTPSFLLLLFPRHDSSPSSFCHRTFGVMVKNLLTKMFTLRLAFTNKNVYPPRLAFPIYEASSLLP